MPSRRQWKEQDIRGDVRKASMPLNHWGNTDHGPWAYPLLFQHCKVRRAKELPFLGFWVLFCFCLFVNWWRGIGHLTVLLLLLVFCLFWAFLTYVAVVTLKFTIKTRLALNSEIYLPLPPNFPTARSTGIHHLWPASFFFSYSFIFESRFLYRVLAVL